MDCWFVSLLSLIPSVFLWLVIEAKSQDNDMRLVEAVFGFIGLSWLQTAYFLYRMWYWDLRLDYNKNRDDFQWFCYQHSSGFIY